MVTRRAVAEGMFARDMELTVLLLLAKVYGVRRDDDSLPAIGIPEAYLDWWGNCCKRCLVNGRSCERSSKDVGRVGLQCKSIKFFYKEAK